MFFVIVYHIIRLNYTLSRSERESESRFLPVSTKRAAQCKNTLCAVFQWNMRGVQIIAVPMYYYLRSNQTILVLFWKQCYKNAWRGHKCCTFLSLNCQYLRHYAMCRQGRLWRNLHIHLPGYWGNYSNSPCKPMLHLSRYKKTDQNYNGHPSRFPYSQVRT